ncbi:unnamed protein product [Notodromas monacha]|uniref:Secretory carrier-associated membrane protein n=1 Tax=Notodromas monacha TaxID=399045 RepID=A0A7R9BIS5_9CRUS|nr:unnamed protein product [Notodromas monacha]CAG0916294.1 unnamed protein product [Notodromas monacha]
MSDPSSRCMTIGCWRSHAVSQDFIHRILNLRFAASSWASKLWKRRHPQINPCDHEAREDEWIFVTLAPSRILRVIHVVPGGIARRNSLALNDSRPRTTRNNNSVVLLNLPRHHSDSQLYSTSHESLPEDPSTLPCCYDSDSSHSSFVVAVKDEKMWRRCFHHRVAPRSRPRHQLTPQVEGRDGPTAKIVGTEPGDLDDLGGTNVLLGSEQEKSVDKATSSECIDGSYPNLAFQGDGDILGGEQAMNGNANSETAVGYRPSNLESLRHSVLRWLRERKKSPTKKQKRRRRHRRRLDIESMKHPPDIDASQRENYTVEKVIMDSIEKGNARKPRKRARILFLIHGVGGSADTWRGQINYFREAGFEIVAPDLLGHGFSSAPDNLKEFEFKHLFADVLAIFDQFIPRGAKAVIVGHSYGCSFATKLARVRPDGVCLLVLISGGGPNPLVPPSNGVLALPTWLLQMLHPCLRVYVQRALFEGNSGRNGNPLSQAYDIPPYVLHHVMRGQIWPEGDSSFHRKIAVPVLLVYGLQDPLVSLVEMCEMERTAIRAAVERNFQIGGPVSKLYSRLGSGRNGKHGRQKGPWARSTPKRQMGADGHLKEKENNTRCSCAYCAVAMENFKDPGWEYPMQRRHRHPRANAPRGKERSSGVPGNLPRSPRTAWILQHSELENSSANMINKQSKQNSNQWATKGRAIGDQRDPFQDDAIRQALGPDGGAATRAFEESNPFETEPSRPMTQVRGASHPPPVIGVNNPPAVFPVQSSAVSQPPAYSRTGQQQLDESAREALKRRERELDEKAQELERRERSLQEQANPGLRKNNWPPLPEKFCVGPCFYQDINVEIPPEFQRIVRLLYYLWMCNGIITGLAAVTADKGAGGVVVGILVLLISLAFAAGALMDFLMLLKVHRIYRSAGASFSKAQEEIRSGVLRHETTRSFMADAASAAVRSQLNPSGPTPRSASTRHFETRKARRNDVGVRRRFETLRRTGHEVEIDKLTDDVSLGLDEHNYFKKVDSFHAEDQSIGMSASMRYRMIERKSFQDLAPREPDLLTWIAKEKIRYLNLKDPQSWTPEKLAESFPCSVRKIKEILRSKWVPKSSNDLEKHDDSVLEAWKVIGKNLGGPLSTKAVDKVTSSSRIGLAWSGSAILPNRKAKSLPDNGEFFGLLSEQAKPWRENMNRKDVLQFISASEKGGSVSLVSWVALKNALYRADCAAKVQFSRISDASDHLRNSSPASSSMPWAFLWSMLKPYLLLLAGAVVSALLVAWLNIEIPRLLGSIIGVVSKFIVNERPIAGEVADASNTPFGAEFFAAIKAPALRLLAVYAFQANMTYIYLRMLSSLGERVASDLRRKLLDSLLVQDITFFDDHRTGDLVNRLTTDVQDFKSSFKLCVSQGLRSSAQALGCLVSAYFISPEMTRMMALVVPAMILVGATIGSSLRRLSKESQAQIAKATAVADEAIGNIRVVRAFGMEEQEKSLYAQEVDKAREFSEKLGHGIALFQGLTNFGLNCLSLGILFLGGSLVSTGQLGAGDLMSFLMATQTIQRSLGQISLIYGHYVRGSTAAGRVYEFLDASPVICIRGGLIIPEQRLKGQRILQVMPCQSGFFVLFSLRWLLEYRIWLLAKNVRLIYSSAIVAMTAASAVHAQAELAQKCLAWHIQCYYFPPDVFFRRYLMSRFARIFDDFLLN